MAILRTMAANFAAAFDDRSLGAWSPPPEDPEPTSGTYYSRVR
jgi:hypothetical protein